MNPAEENVFYHACASAMSGEYDKLLRLRERSKNWKRAWETIATDGAANPATLMERLRAAGIALFLRDEPAFPSLLREIPLPPFGIYVMGTLPDAERPALAIVGTRKATEEGKECASVFARELAAAGVVIVSGLALGIDAAAHAGCLEAKGTTVAVLGNGLPRIYPRLHERLAKDILKRGGALISEYPPGTPSFPSHFLERNRIVSGLSRGTLVIEAPRASGALATARFAMEQNREVFVLPGPAAHPNFRGSHRLIRSGAELVTEPNDVLQTLGLLPQEPAGSDTQDSDERLVLEALKSAKTPLSLDNIIELTHLKAPVVSRTVSFLLMKNAVREEARGYRSIA